MKRRKRKSRSRSRSSRRKRRSKKKQQQVNIDKMPSSICSICSILPSISAGFSILILIIHPASIGLVFKRPGSPSASSSASLISTISPPIGAYNSDAAFTLSTAPNVSIFGHIMCLYI